MVLIAADTSGKHGSVALVRAEVDGKAQPPAITKFDPLEVVPLEGGTFSAQLVPQISGLLARHGISKNHLDGFAVVSGPGSFTGLRVGLAAIKGLAEVLKKPITALSLLEALGRMANHRGRVLSGIDAGRREVYFGDYDFAKADPCIREELLSQNELAAKLRSNVGTPFVTPDQKLAELAHDLASKVMTVNWPPGDFIARLGLEKIVAGKTVSPEDLEANYIRRSDAEIFSKPNSQES